MENKEKIAWFSVHNKGLEYLSLYAIGEFSLENKDVEFGEKEIRVYVEEKLKQVGEITFSRDLSNPITKNTINSGKSYKEKNKEWYEKDNAKITLTKNGQNEFKKLKEYINLQVKTLEEISPNINIERMEENSSSKTIKEIVGDIKTGVIAQIPTFQREYVWNYEAVAPLLLSILKGFPIGSLLYWYQDENNYVILDGLQRTFSLTLIDNNNYAYIDYELYSYFCKEIYKQEPLVTERIFDISLEKWKKDFDGKTEEKQSKKHMIESFNHNPQIIGLINYIEQIWSKVKDSYSIPFIKLDQAYSRDEAADIFNIINSTGKELNKFEVNSSIWSKTPIKLNYALTSKHKIIEWKTEKENKYRKKIKAKKGVDILVDEGNKKIEISDFIYATFDMASLNLPLIRNVFYKNGRINNNAIEPLLTIYINYFMLVDKKVPMVDHDEMMPLLGQYISNKIKKSDDIDDFVKKLESKLKLVETKLALLKSLTTNSKGISIPIAASLLSLLINISIKENKKIIDNLTYIFTHEYFLGNYSTGSTKNAWSELKKEDYKNWDKNVANSTILGYVEEEHNRTQPRGSYDNKMVYVLALFKQIYLSDNKVTDHHVDHIVPKTIVETAGGKDNQIKTNHVNSFYNLQLLTDDLNKAKNSRMDYNEDWFTFENIKDPDFNKEEYRKKFNSLYKKVKSDLCKETKKGTCQKKAEIVSYDNFEKLIEFQRTILEPFIKKGLF